MKQTCFCAVLLIATSRALPGQVPAVPDAVGARITASAKSADGSAPAIFQVGGDVRPPKLIHSVEPQYSKRAKKKKISGVVKVKLYVDKEGLPQDVHVAEGVGYGLDEEALRAVQRYRFEPATKNNIPVAVELEVQVNFLLM